MSNCRAPLKLLIALIFGLFAASSVMAVCNYLDWDETTPYSRGDRVTWAEHEWKSKRNSTGTEPGTHRPSWADQGLCADGGGGGGGGGGGTATPIQIFGVWHAGNHYADWSMPLNMVEFENNNQWLVDRNMDGVYDDPSVNLVILSFLNPLEVLNMVPGDPKTGLPAGMTEEVVMFFKNAGIRVMMSIGGQTYVDFWNEAMATDADATRLGTNAAAIATYFGVGMEIDYEENTDPDLVGLQYFIDAYRLEHAYDPTGVNHAARLTIDLAAGGRYLQTLNRHATENWLRNDFDLNDGVEERVLDYANAMVHRSSGTPTNWQEHVDGKPTYDPVIPPKAPNKFTGGLYIKGNMSNCKDFESSEQAQHAEYVMTVQPAGGTGTTPGMLGYMFWATGVPSARKNYKPTYPPNSCEGGMGVAAAVFNIPIPMPALRQE